MDDMNAASGDMEVRIWVEHYGGKSNMPHDNPEYPAKLGKMCDHGLWLHMVDKIRPHMKLIKTDHKMMCRLWLFFFLTFLFFTGGVSAIIIYLQLEGDSMEARFLFTLGGVSLLLTSVFSCIGRSYIHTQGAEVDIAIEEIAEKHINPKLNQNGYQVEYQLMHKGLPCMPYCGLKYRQSALIFKPFGGTSRRDDDDDDDEAGIMTPAKRIVMPKTNQASNPIDDLSDDE